MASRERPYFKSYLAQSVYDKMLNDEKLKIMDFSMWYKVHEICLSDSSRSLFIPMNVDAETRQFVDSCFAQADYVFLQIWHSIAKSFLGLFMTQTSINGLLNRGRMFVWSKNQARLLLDDQPHLGSLETDLEEHLSEGTSSALSYLSHLNEKSSERVAAPQCDLKEVDNQNSKDHKIYIDAVPDTSSSEFILTACPKDAPPDDDDAPYNENSVFDNSNPETADWWTGKIVLDLGAGDGHVTQILATSASKVFVTETSPVMRKRLSDKGYTVLNADSWDKDVDKEFFDLITCLNLLDRCDMPISLLRTIHNKLAPSGKLVIAIVLPISPYVETGTSDHEPSENLGITGVMIEDQVNSLIEDVFPSLGFNTLRWTRLPYLCEGDMDQAFYWLSDIVFILNKKNQES